MFGVCPLYSIIGVSTCRANKTSGDRRWCLRHPTGKCNVDVDFMKSTNARYQRWIDVAKVLSALATERGQYRRSGEEVARGKLRQ
jgi:hypothetical protein